MFASLSFKRLRHRLRAITLFKKFTKKSKSKQKAPKQEDNTHTDDINQRPVHPELVVDSSLPEITVEASSFEASSGSKTISPPTPAKADHLPTGFLERTQPVSKEEEITAEKKTTNFSYPRRALVDESKQAADIDKQNPILTDSVPIVAPLVDNDVDQDSEKTATLRDPEPVYTANFVQDKQETTQNNQVDEVPATHLVIGPVAVEEPFQDAEIIEAHTSIVVDELVQDAEIARRGSNHDDIEKPVDVELSNPAVVDCSSPESPPFSEPVVETRSENIPSTPSPPQTPRSNRTAGGPLRTPSPRKRVVSEAREDQDASIMSELQASVRSREKRRLEKEKIEAEEKKREERELRQSVAATMGKEFTELGVWKKTDDPADRETVLREVRSWRKQRESSFKVKVDDSGAKTAAFNEALSNEEIMVDLMSAVQSRSLRAPCFIDPRENRQTLLEDLFARRVQLSRA